MTLPTSSQAMLPSQATLTQAVILAGGRGERLRPLTNALPKPMLPFHGKPFLEFLIARLASQGIRRVTLLLGFLPERIQEYFKGGERFGVTIDIRSPRRRMRPARAFEPPRPCSIRCSS